MQASQSGSSNNNNNDDSSTSENNESNMTMYEFARHLIETQGIQVFWTGFETSALQSATEKALYFLPTLDSRISIAKLCSIVIRVVPLQTQPGRLAAFRHWPT